MIIALKKFTDEGVFTDEDFIDGLRRKMASAPGWILDFTGVTGVSSNVLAGLLEGVPAATLDARIQGAEGATAEALRTWVSTPPPPTEAPLGLETEAPRPRTMPPSLPFVRPTEAGERYTPSRLSARLRHQLRSYIESAYPLADPQLIEARRNLLERAEGGHLLAQEPFVETTPRYPQSERGYGQLGLSEALGGFLEELTRTGQDHDPRQPMLYPELYGHQARALVEFLLHGRDLVVATGTGSGKTECFLVPLLARLFEEAQARPQSFARPGVRALVLYPMNALVNDQLARLRQLLGSERVAERFRALSPGGRHPLFGMYTSRTPYPGPRDATKDASRVAPLLEALLGLDEGMRQELASRGRLPAKDLRAFYGGDQAEQGVYRSGARKGQCYTRHHWPRRLLTGPLDRELLTRQEMVHDPTTGQGRSPDVLITNYSMLEYMLMRPFERPIFEETRRWLKEEGASLLLVLDEAHLYRGARGAEVAFLLRRLQARLEVLGQPDKFRVILTSASLGGQDAQQVAQRFAADLTGKSPERFEVITAERATEGEGAPGEPGLAEVLASVDLEKLQGDGVTGGLHEQLTPVLAKLGVTLPSGTDDDVLAVLRAALREQPVVRLLLDRTAGKAVSLDELTRTLFGSLPQARRATEALLSLGTMARVAPGEPGLLPTRIHLMFRGFEGMYACLDPHCAHDGSGRVEQPNPSGLGKLFERPRLLCDSCGARVFEVASCRECGTAYLKAYAPRGQAARPEFLWGEVEGELEPWMVLPVRPRTTSLAEEVAVQLSTGLLLDASLTSTPGVRTLFVPREPESGARREEFKRCPVCQPEGSRRSTHITDLRTRGEQAFGALVDAQFSEQPPMRRGRPELPNEGRKVLVFSDGRQRAARLAPALETSHQSDVFRQVLVLAARALTDTGERPRLALLYPAVLHVCHTRTIELYATHTDEKTGAEVPDDTFRHHLRMAREVGSLRTLVDLSKQGLLQPPRAYGRNLYEALTDKFLSVRSMGLAVVEEDESVAFLLRSFPEIGFSPLEARQLLRTWIDVQLGRRCFLPPGTSLDQATEGWDLPEGIDLSSPRTLLPERFEHLLRSLVGQQGVARLLTWLPAVVKTLGQSIDDRYYLVPMALSLRLRLDEGFSRCPGCGKLHLDPLRGRCHECQALVPAESAEIYLEAKFGYYRDQVRRALMGKGIEPFGLVTAEHSAQLAGVGDGDVFSKTELHELRFQDIRIDDLPPIDVLSCTTTMEVGIDIGSLTAVALRNVPPHVASYQQRAGRAGRRGLVVASVVTYAHGGTHDAHYFRQPADIIAGTVRAPIVYTENVRVLRRHVSAYLVQRYFHEQVDEQGASYHLFASMGTVGDFLSEEHACSYLRLRRWLEEHQASLRAELGAWVPSFCHGFDRPIAASLVVDQAVAHLLEGLEKTLPLEAYAKRASLPPAEQEALAQTLDDNLLELLIQRAVFPRYAFPIDTVSFWVQRPRGSKHEGPPSPRFDYQPQRDLQLALTEYAPGRTLTLDKWRFTSAALYSPYVARVSRLFEEARSYTACRSCGWVSLSREERARTTCPICASPSPLSRDFVRPEGFAPDVNLPREKDKGGTIVLRMPSTPARLEIQEAQGWDEERHEGRLRLVAGQRRLVTVNKGVGERGFVVCAECGLAEPTYGPGFTQSRLTRKGQPTPHLSPIERNRSCHGALLGPVYLGHEFVTDVLLMRVRVAPPMSLFLGESSARSGQASRAALTSLVEALVLAASRALQIDEGELAGNWSPALGEESLAADVYLYDVLPGGAGYTRQLLQHLDRVLTEAELLVSRCSCVSSCYECLRHYNNQPLHASLDRHLARSLLRWVTRGDIPRASLTDVTTALLPMVELLRLQGHEVKLDEVAGDTRIPMKIMARGQETWVDVLHPLLDPEALSTPVQQAAFLAMRPCVPLDAYRLEHALPAAVAQLLPSPRRSLS